MKFGTVVYENKIYNLDYMTSKEIETLLKKIESSKSKNITEGKNILKKFVPLKKMMNFYQIKY